MTPSLWSSIQAALDSSDYFVLLASPQAARSHWVNREVEYWIDRKSPDRILPVLTDGHWQWDPVLGDFTEDSTAVPATLRGAFADEPLFLDLRWARDDQQLDLRHSRFRNAIAQLAAPMHGLSTDELEGEDIRQHRRALRLRVAALAALAVLAFATMLTGVLAMRNAARANASAQEAQLQHQEASAQRNSAAWYAEEAGRQQKAAEEQQARAKTARTEAENQERLARTQHGIANRASADAARQLSKASRTAKLAREQQRLAVRQTALATESARAMREQQQRVKEQQRLLVEQERLTAEARAEAGEQQRLAGENEQRAATAGAEADRQLRIAIGRRLFNEAQATLDDDPRTAHPAARGIEPGAEAGRTLASLTTSTNFAGSLPDVTAVAYGRKNVLATVDSAGTASLWKVADRANPVRLATLRSDGSTSALAFSPTGRILAVAASPGRVSLWDVTNPARPVPAGTLSALDEVFSMTFSPDGQTLVTVSQHEDPVEGEFSRS